MAGHRAREPRVSGRCAFSEGGGTNGRVLRSCGGLLEVFFYGFGGAEVGGVGVLVEFFAGTTLT